MNSKQKEGQRPRSRTPEQLFNNCLLFMRTRATDEHTLWMNTLSAPRRARDGVSTECAREQSKAQSESPAKPKGRIARAASANDRRAHL